MDATVLEGHMDSKDAQHVSVVQAMLPRSLHHKPLFVESASGISLHLQDGRTILDASGGAAVACIGHGEPRIRAAVNSQMEMFSYAHTLTFTNHPGEDLAQFLLNTTQGRMSRVYFVGSGSEAMEAALKLARQYFLELSPSQPQRTHFISRRGSYHGITLGALAVSGHDGRRSMFEPVFMQNCSQVSACNPYRDLGHGETLESYAERLQEELEQEILRVGQDKVCAFIVEPVVGAALGCVTSIPGYLRRMQDVCQKYGVLLIFDEVMCGMGRTGTTHAWQQEQVVPDLQTIGKALSGGYIPLAGLLVRGHVVDTLGKGTGAFSHGHTFQAHPVACAAALEVQKMISERNLLANVQEMGALLYQKLIQELDHHPFVGNIRGRGLFWGIELVQDKTSKEPFLPEKAVAMSIHELGLVEGILLYPGTGSALEKRGDHVMPAPPFNVTKEQVTHIVELTARVLRKFFSERSLKTLLS